MDKRPRGRESFNRWRGVLVLGVWFVRLFPRKVAQLAWACCEWVPGNVGAGLRFVLARRLAKAIGDVVYFGPQVEVLAWDRLSVGSHVSIHRGCYLDATGGIVIGDDVSIAHSSSVMSTEHQWADESRPIRDNPLLLSAVSIHSDVWVGCGARILAGTTVNTRAIVAAGAVVTKDVATRTIVAGVPARVLRTL